MKKIILLILLSFMSLTGFAQILNEGFEAAPANPDGSGVWTLGSGNWLVTDNRTNSTPNWQRNAPLSFPANTGQYAAYVNRENAGDGVLTEEWLITPQLTITANAQLRFFTRQTLVGAPDPSTIYEVRVSSSANQSDLSAFTTVLASYTEATLSTITIDQLDYEEKLLNLGFTGARYFAFVKVFTQVGDDLAGDRWLIDDVKIVTQCVDPIAPLSATAISATGATLGWTMPTGNTQNQFEIEYGESGFPQGTGTVITGITSSSNPRTTVVPSGTLQPSTCYQFYVRSVCPDATSLWVGPFNFCTIPLGSVCSAPIVVPPAPYSDTSNTTIYGNNITNGTPGTSCGAGAGFLGGNDVVYSYTVPATTTGLLNISMIPLNGATNTGVFVYNSCATIGTSCIAGVGNATGNIRNIPALNVTAGQTIYIVISSTTATPTFGYTLIIQDVNCVQPINGVASDVNPHEATIKWANGTGSVSTAWQVVVQTAGSPIPNFPGYDAYDPDNTLGIAASSALFPTPGPLVQDTTYEFWIRADCGNNTFSAWSGPYSFTTPPTCPKPTFVDNATVTTFESITVSYTNNSNATEFETYYVECGGPAPTAGSVGTTTTQTANVVIGNLNSDTCYDVYVRALCGPGDLSTWTGPLTATTQIVPPACGGTYTDSGGSNADYEGDEDSTITICPTVPGEKVTVTFTSFNTEATWDGLYIYDGNSVNAPQLASANPAGNAGGPLTTPGAYWGTVNPGTFTSTSADGCLTFRFLSDPSFNEEGWVANVTCAPPPPCPKPTGFALGAVTATTAVLNFGNPGNAVSFGVIALLCGSPAPTMASPWITTGVNAPSYTITGLLPDTCYDFYVMANCGAVDGPSAPAGPRTATTQIAPPECGGTYSDPGGSGANYPNNSNVTITICPTVPGEKVTVTFTAFDTEANWDGIYVYDGNSTGAPQIASANPVGNGPMTIPGAFWGTTIPGPFTSTSADGCLTFNFRSDGSFNEPGWTALVTCAPPPTCAIPKNLAIPDLTVTHNSVVFNWTQPASPDGSTATAWQVLYLPCDSPAPTANATGWIPASQLSNLIEDLTPDTCYDFYVRAVCSETDSSPWAGPISVTTDIAPPVCGGVFTDLGGVNGDYPNGADSTVTICPTNPGEIVTVTFTLFDTEANWDGLYVFDGPNINSPQIASNNPTGNGPLAALAGAFWGNPAVLPGPFTSTSPDGCLTFRFRSDGSFDDIGWVANVTCSPAPTCLRPNPITATSILQTSANFTWLQPTNPDGSVAGAWEVIVLPFGAPAPDENTNGIPTNTAAFTASGLQAGTRYVIYVRAICSATDSSEWSAFNFATPPANDECINATFAVVNQNLNCAQTTPGTVVGATTSLPAPSCAGANDDVWYTFTATDATHIVSFNNVVPANSDLDYAVYTGTDCGTLTQHGACNIADNLTPGTTYYIRIFTPGTAVQNITFDLCIGTLPCTEAPAFCTGQTVTYQNTTNVPSLGQIGCLFTSPNPAFFFLQVNQAGPLNYLISQVDNNGVPRDVDYVTWGPFTDLQVACNAVPANPLPGVIPAPTPAQGCPPNDQIHACSYSAAPTEIVCLPNAQLCEVYVIMITNFSNQPGFVTFTQTNNNGGTTECFPINTFNYPETRYCQDGVDPIPQLAPGATPGTYTSTPGLVIDSVTGVIDLSASTPGAYIVTSTTLTSTGGACDNIPSIVTTRTVIITAPADATIAYAAATYCSSITTPQAVVVTGTPEGSFSATPNGLNLNPGTGDILPIASQPGVYTVTYTVAAEGGCPAFTTTAQVEIIATPLIPFINNVVSCESTYTLPALTIGNYYTLAGGPNGQGVMLNAGDVISEDTTIYVYSITGDCTDEKSFTITLGDLEVPPVSDVSECTSYTLPALPAGFGYYAATGGQTPLSGTLTSSQLIYVYGTQGTCSAEASFQLTIGSVDAGDPADIVSCTTVTLATLPANSTYYTATGGPTGIGTVITDLNINTSQTIYIWAQSGTCTDEADFDVTINSSLTPVFTAIPNPCVGSVGATLPLVSDNGIGGTWDTPVVQTGAAGTTVYTFTPSAAFPCAVQTTLSVTVDAPIVPIFTPIADICLGGVAPGLPLTSDNGITGTWTPAVINTSIAGTVCYTFNPDPAFTCATTAQMCVTITAQIVPQFVQVADICQNTVAAVLPTVSQNGVSGSWTSLGVIDTATPGVFPYIFTPDATNVCAIPVTMLITILPAVAPTFTPIPDICLNDVAPVLPTVSLEGVTGTWSGTIDTTTTGSQTLTFLPSGGQPCALNGTITVNVIAPLVPDFTPITLCFGQPAPILSGTSPNGITGNWVPATINNTLTQTYTFTPSVACALPQTITVTINPQISPNFAPIANFCAGANAPLLATTSPNGLVGVWSPAVVSNTASGCYVFTPDFGQCAEPQTLCVTVDQPVTPDFVITPTICSGTTAPALPTTSPNGVAGTWSPATVSNTDDGCYVFTPNAGICANQQTVCVTVNDTPELTLKGECEGNAYVIRVVQSNFVAQDANYQWQRNGVDMVGEDNAFLVADGIGTYTLIAEVNNCTGEADWMVGGIACSIQKGISPKGVGPGDNKNDFFDLASMDVKKLQIFNRYGKIVYSQENYTNQWYGQTDKGDELPDGTYYYVIDMNGGGEPKTGWIYINREQ